MLPTTPTAEITRSTVRVCDLSYCFVYVFAVNVRQELVDKRISLHSERAREYLGPTTNRLPYP